MRWALTGLLLLHGLIHSMGFLKAFGLAELTQLHQPISRPLGVLWLVATVAMLVAAFAVPARWFWIAGTIALVLSQVVIISAWSDAKFGTLANVVVLLAIVYSFAAHGPFSFEAQYLAAVDEGLARPPAVGVVTEQDLENLPAPVQKYLRVTGAIGQPRLSNFKLTWRGRIRGGPTEPWMEFEAEQHNFFGPSPSRLFLLRASRAGLPVDVFHRYVGDAATFRVRLLSIVPMVDAKGPEMNRAETVTLFNDLCFFAPAALIDPAIRWEPKDDRSARAHFTRGPETITAELWFDQKGELVDFSSDDRARRAADGTFVKDHWTTPVREYRAFGPRRVGTRGEARSDSPTGPFAYGEFELQGIEYNLAPSPAPRAEPELRVRVSTSSTAQ
ncbi:MAG: hypothetical protein Q8L48_31535 [Archangium sp.]|nr:hypothetical protein [Archangium sp.]